MSDQQRDTHGNDDDLMQFEFTFAGLGWVGFSESAIEHFGIASPEEALKVVNEVHAKHGVEVEDGEA